MKFWNFIKGKARGLLGKMGVGKFNANKKDKKEKKGKDFRNTEEKKRDLDDALKESHNLLKSGMNQAKIKSKLHDIKNKYELKELRIILEEKVEKGIKVHVHGEVNPKKDSPTEILRVDDFNPSEGNKILLVGEANFSFSLSLANTLALQNRMVATSYDSENTKYKDKDNNIKEHKKLGSIIEYNVDATSTSYEPNHFEIIVFNFPWIKEETRGGTTNNKMLLKSFFNEANRIIKKGGKVLLSLSDERYVSRWKPEEQANSFVLESKKLFDSKNFPGYEHKMTQKDRSAGSMEDGKGVTLIFKNK
ncbi:hypothetical protein ASG22_16050 [Chryseobacterium sp. Leaf405]|uniref:class I SAM-dependent methyltransferase n=1 Tax=Chryseobacterium sp. Leaf405 TaxID=1736367 RepID=UPI000712C6CA|nr:class I SAM-dependent methyltransferase [Chryseobacterium sp. Leaf405]KQT20930.1 hypothetical protein ASG22_16050 [Chryseobacterium sp. Leaf405]